MRFWSIQTPVLLFFLSVGCGSAGDKDEVGTPPPLSTPDPVVETVDVDADGTPAEDDCDDEDDTMTTIHSHAHDASPLHHLEVAADAPASNFQFSDEVDTAVLQAISSTASDGARRTSFRGC